MTVADAESNQHDDGERLIVVGMGASAGGLEAFSEFLRHMPDDSGMAFVLVQHLDPHHQSIMPELLAKDTAMSVRQVQDETPVEANHVYVIPPNATLSIQGGVLRVATPPEPRDRRMAIDSFFHSLAEDLGARAVCIVLSGTGSDGTLGLRAIKEHGGLAIAQAAEGARYDSMPRNAIATRMVDYVLSVREMPQKLAEYARHVRDHDLPSGTEQIAGEDSDALAGICQVLQRRTGHDFSRYKRGTVLRRLQRRMRVLQLESLREYAARLQGEPKEVDELFRDLLISVTQFFREPDVFQSLQTQVIPAIFAALPTDGSQQSVRIWVPGCATGEEAYSIAMLICEHQAQHESVARVQVFATDIDEHALEFARAGRYPEGIAEQVSSERLKNFFTHEGTTYTIRKNLREMCLFSTHNLIKDPPFSSLDLISCRNVLIYLESDLQRKLVPVFHYALRPQRYLLLGPTEGIATHSNLFRAVEKKHHIYQAKQTAVRAPMEFPLSRTIRREESGRAAMEPMRHSREANAVRTLERMLLEEFAPASVVFNERAEIAYFIGKCGKYLAPSVGTPSNNLLDMARDGLGLPLRTAIYRSTKSREPVVHDRIMVQTNGHLQPVRLTVRPLSEIGDENDLFIAIFQDLPDAEAQPAAAAAAREGDENSIARQLDAELRQTRDQLQSTIEQMEAGHEELKSSNEELLSMNEELQSSNEQLQTSKEELQSVNEELGTVNAELNKKVDELDRANSDLQNLFQSTQIATIFLDEQLRIKRFTPAATQVFRIIDSDIDRPIIDFAPRFAGVDVGTVVKDVLRTLMPREFEIQLREPERCFMMRLHPYRTLGNLIAGVVMSFVDITDLVIAQREQSRLAGIVDTSHDCIIGKDLDGTIMSWNAAAEQVFGYSAAEAIGRPVTLIIPPEGKELWSSTLDRLRRGEKVEPVRTVRVDKHGLRIDLHIAYSLMKDREGRIVGISSISRDIRQLIEAETQALKRTAEIEAIMEAVPAAVWIATDPSGQRIVGNRESYRLLRMKEGSNQSITAPPAEAPTHFRVMKNGTDLPAEDLPVQKACISGEPVVQWENDVLFDDGTVRHILGNAVPLFDATARPSGAVAAFIDITELKESQRALKQTAEELRRRVVELEAARLNADEANRAKDKFIAILSHELRTPLTPVLTAAQLVLRQRDSFPEEFRNLLEVIERNVTLEARLIDDLLDLNRLIHGKMALQRQSIALAAAIEDVIEICEPDAQAKQISLELQLDRNVTLSADPARLKQIVWNLVRNAIQHSKDRSVIRIRLERAGSDAVNLEVADSGEGISAERLADIFEAFERGDEPGTTRTRGLGLGLAICKTLVELHGGSIAAFSDGVGMGARFVVVLPLGEERAGPADQVRPSGLPNLVSRRSSNRVLFVEDNADTAAMTALALRMNGLDVMTCGTVAEAARMIAEQPPDILISDIGLPDANGFELIGRVRAAGFTGPAIAMSGFGMESDVARATDAGFTAHLTKPVEIARLESVIASLLSGKVPDL